MVDDLLKFIGQNHELSWQILHFEHENIVHAEWSE
jgi:hypothetical protein